MMRAGTMKFQMAQEILDMMRGGSPLASTVVGRVNIRGAQTRSLGRGIGLGPDIPAWSIISGTITKRGTEGGYYESDNGRFEFRLHRPIYAWDIRVLAWDAGSSVGNWSLIISENSGITDKHYRIRMDSGQVVIIETGVVILTISGGPPLSGWFEVRFKRDRNGFFEYFD